MSPSALSVAAFLPPRLLTHVKHVFADEPDLLVASSWEELESFIRRKPVSVVILDPSASGTLDVDAVARLIKRYPSLPLVAYVTLHAPTFKAIAQLGKLGLEDVVLHRFDDAPERFRERVEQVQGNSLTRRAVEELRGSLQQLPRPLLVAIENMFEQPHRYNQAFDLAAAGMPIVAVYRNLDAAGLGSPKRLVVAAKVLRAFGYLNEPGYSVLDVSIKLGYKTTRIFCRHWVAVFGATPARVRNRLTDDEALALVLEWIRTGGDDPGLHDEGSPGLTKSGRHRRHWKAEPS
jgi:AraC-like DNA-binding protein